MLIIKLMARQEANEQNIKMAEGTQAKYSLLSNADASQGFISDYRIYPPCLLATGL
jgi:hypothetical protein